MLAIGGAGENQKQCIPETVRNVGSKAEGNEPCSTQRLILQEEKKFYKEKKTGGQ